VLLSSLSLVSGLLSSFAISFPAGAGDFPSSFLLGRSPYISLDRALPDSATPLHPFFSAELSKLSADELARWLKRRALRQCRSA
jgi:hypothetical protein